MKRRRTYGVLLLLVGALAGPARGQPFDVHGVLGAGGGVSSGATYRLVSTLGQPMAGTAEGLGSGFWTWTQAGVATHVEDEAEAEPPRAERPTRAFLAPGYPNPLTTTTVVAYGVPKPTYVELVIYNMLGQRVRTLQARVQPAGVFRVVWDGRDGGARPVASGVYLVRLETATTVHTRTLLLVR